MSPNDVGEQILVVEDDPEMGELLHRGLTAVGYEVSLTTDGVEALIVAASTEFAAAIVDVMLPGMTGFELCRRLKESRGPVRVLLLTARNSVDDRVFGLDSGADDYLTKPFAFAELSARLRALLRREDPTVKLVLNVGGSRTRSWNRRKVRAVPVVGLCPTSQHSTGSSRTSPASAGRCGPVAG